MSEVKEEKDRFHGEAGEVVWHESDEDMFRKLAAEGYTWFEAPGKRRIDLTKYREDKS